VVDFISAASAGNKEFTRSRN